MNADLTEREFPPLPPYLVGREKIREFARATFATNPIHLDPEAAREAGYSDVVAPPTFPVVLSTDALHAVVDAENSGIDFSRVVHGEQSFQFERPIVAGDEITTEYRVSSIKSLGGNSMVAVESTFRDGFGEAIGSATGSIVVRGEDA